VFTSGAVRIERTYEYDGAGKRTVTNETHTVPGLEFSRKCIRAYNSDGTLNTITYPFNHIDTTPVTLTFTWENGKKIVDEDVYLAN
jgi:hypothetical protein